MIARHVSIALLCVTAVAFTACQKETAPLPGAGGDGTIVGQTKSSPNLIWQPDNSGGGNHQCPPNGSKCTKESFLSPADKTVIGTVFTTIVGGNQSQIIAAFTTHKTTLVKYIDTSLVDDVINGVILPTALTNASSGVRFMIFRASPNERVYEFPKP